MQEKTLENEEKDNLTSESEITEDERKRYNILIDRGGEAIDRLASDIHSLKSRSLTFIGISLAILSFIFTEILFLSSQTNWQPSILECILVGTVSVLLLFSVLINLIAITLRTKYKEINIFEDKRFNELKEMAEKTLLSDFLHFLKKSYDSNKKIYDDQMRGYNITLYLFTFAVFLLIILVIINLTG